MDRRNNFHRFKDMLATWESNEITIHQLQALIATYITSTPRTIDQHIRVMGMTGLIKDIGSSRFEIVR